MNRPLRTAGLVAAYSGGHAAAGRLHDTGLDHPQVTRFVTWYFVERGDGREVRPFVAASVADKSPRSRTPSGAGPSPTAWAREGCSPSSS